MTHPQITTPCPKLSLAVLGETFAPDVPPGVGRNRIAAGRVLKLVLLAEVYGGRVLDRHELSRRTAAILEKPRQRRKQHVDRLIKQAERAGKTVTSVTTPDGHTLTFDQPGIAAANPWDEVLKDAPDKKRST